MRNSNISGYHRDLLGDTSILGDERWAGSYGINANFVAGLHCSVARVHTCHVQVILKLNFSGQI